MGKWKKWSTEDEYTSLVQDELKDTQVKKGCWLT